jgi:hypothetical protein
LGSNNGPRFKALHQISQRSHPISPACRFLLKDTKHKKVKHVELLEVQVLRTTTLPPRLSWKSFKKINESEMLQKFCLRPLKQKKLASHASTSYLIIN